MSRPYGRGSGGERGGGGFRGGRGGGGGDDRGGGFRGGRGGGGGDRGGGFRGGRGGGPVPIEVFRGPSEILEPDATVAKLEDDFMKKVDGINAIARLKLTAAMPLRPGHGTQGTPTKVYANYFEVTPTKSLKFYRYDANVTSEGKAPKPSARKMQRIFEILLEDARFNDVMTDFRAMIISHSRISDKPFDVVVTFRAEGEDAPRGDDPFRYRITIQETGTVDIAGLLSYLKSTDPAASNPGVSEIIQVLNNVIGHFAKSRSDVVTIGKNKHYSLDRNPTNLRILGGGMEALRGYYKSARLGTGRILLNVNVSHGVFYEPIRLDYMMSKLGTAKLLSLAKYLKYLSVNRLHLPARKNKAHKVIPSIVTIWSVANTDDGLEEEHPPQVRSFGAGPKDVKFFLKTGGGGPSVKGAKGARKKPSAGQATEGRYISVYDYFNQNYGSITMNPKYPVVNVGNRARPSYLPAEACLVLPGQRMKRKLLADETRAMIEFACRRPKANADSIVGDGRAILGISGSNPAMARYGLSFGNSLITVPARILMPPQIKYGGTKSLIPRGGSWNMEGIKFAQGSEIKQWTYLNITSNRGTVFNLDPGHLRAIVEKFRIFMNRSGINIKEHIKTPPPPTLHFVDGEEAKNEMSIGSLFKAMCSSEIKPKFLLIVLPFNDAAIYRKIKTVADIRAGIHTICVVGSKFSKEQRQEQYFANVALKFNLKAGGINHTLDPLKLGIISEGKTMVVGIDVTHPSPNSKEGAPSVASIVASVDKILGQWPGDIRIQEGRKEMVTDLGGMLKSRLALWQKHNKNQLPDNVLIYRDGVSEGQYQTVLDEELPLLRHTCQEVYPATATKAGLPRFSIVVVGKRHHTRFFPTKEADADRSHNTKNGLIVDRGITEVRNWDFFLQAHACLQGTARPAHYYVIIDEIFRSNKPKNPAHKHAADALEDLTHNMCHLFARATKAVSICPPAYYADLLCERARCYLGRIFDPVSPSDTPAMSQASSIQSEAQPQDVLVHKDLKDTMFYM